MTREDGTLAEAMQYDAYGMPTLIDDGPDADNVVNFTSDDARRTGWDEGSHRGTRFLFTGWQ